MSDMTLSKKDRHVVRISYILNGPIHYRVPLAKALAKTEGVAVRVIFDHDVLTKSHHDPHYAGVVDFRGPSLDNIEHTFLFRGYHARFPLLAYARRIGRELKRHGPDLVWIHAYSRPEHVIALIVARMLGAKIIIRDTTTLISESTLTAGWLRRSAKRAFYWWLNKTVAAVLAVGTRNREHALAYGIAPKKVFMVPNAVDNEALRQSCSEAKACRSELKRRLSIDSNAPVVLYVGRMIECKRPTDLVQAVSLVSKHANIEPYLVFVGTGPLEDDIRATAKECSLNRIRFAGFVDQSEIGRYYELADIFALTSSSETFGLVLNEAMNASKPLVVSDRVGAAVDLVRQGDNGFVYPCGDVEALSQAIEYLVRHKPERESMGRCSLEIIDQWNYEVGVGGILQAAHFALRKTLGDDESSSALV